MDKECGGLDEIFRSVSGYLQIDTAARGAQYPKHDREPQRTTYRAGSWASQGREAELRAGPPDPPSTPESPLVCDEGKRKETRAGRACKLGRLGPEGPAEE